MAARATKGPISVAFRVRIFECPFGNGAGS